MPPSSADSSAAYWTRVYCKYNAGSGSFVCDSGQVTGNSASCSAANGVNCAEEGNVYCYSSSSCEKQGSSSAGPTNAYNVNWDSDSADCACKVGSGNWNIGFESGTSASCCGDDSGEYKKVEAQGTDAPSLFDDGTDACCNSNSDCIEAGNCKTHATTYGTIPSKGYCNSGSWQGGDAGSTQCTAIVASSRWAIGGETASADCCGDDSSENKRTRSAGTDSTYSTSSTDDGCCTASNKCVYSSSCTSSTSTRGTIPNKNYCNAGTWQGGDAGSTQCTAIVASSRWAIGGETASANCCGDDSSENKITRTIGADSTYTASPSDYGCCTVSNKCTYSDTCYSSGSTRGSIPIKNYCNAGTWQGGDASSTACSQIAVGYDGTCTNGNDFCWDATPGVNKCCGDDYGDVGTTDYFYTPNVGGCIPKSSGIVYDTTKPIITDISSSTSVDYYYNKTGATTGIVYFNSAIADGQAIIFTVSWTEANSEYGEDDLKAIKVSGLYGGKGESDNVYPSQGTLTYTFNSGDSNGTLDIYVRDAVWLNDTKSITFEEDLILPAGTIIINSGDSFTDDTRVNLTLTYSDNIGVRDCAFSNDNIEWTFWQNCTEQKSWSLIDEDGRRYVYYKVRDFAGNVRVVNSSIFLDRQIPQIIINDNTTHTNSIDVNLSLDFSSILGDSVECSFMNDSMPWTEWGPCPTSPYPLYPEINWTLRSGASGIRTVSVKVNTSFGVVREANDSIMYDPEPPTGSIDIWAINVPGIQEANNHTTAYTTVSLKLIYNDNDEIAGCRYANDENLEANFTAWQSCTTPKTWILNDEDGNRTVYYQIKDYAGNIFETNDTIALDKTGAGQDTTPPSAATVIDDGIWTNDSTKLHAIWSGAYDRESEILNIPLIYEYSIGTSQGAIDVVGWTSVETNTEMTHTGLNLIDGQIYFINVRVINSAGLTNESSSDGITVDTIPCQITSLSSSHDNGNWTNNSQCNNPQFSWAGDVGGSGVYGYSYILDFDSATNPDTIPEGDYEDLSGETSIRYDNIIDGKLNFHVRCRDNAGNWGDEVDLEHFAVWIDASPPTTPQMTEHEIITDQENMTFNWTESIEVHSFNVTYEFELYNHSVFNSTYLINKTNRTLEHITIFNLTSGVTYYPRVRAWNRAELHSSWSSEVSTIIDYLGPDINIITPGDNGCNLSSLYPVIRAETNEWAICSFKDFSVPTAGFIDFDYTSSEYHESRANVNETNLYTFNITCMDAIGNSADVSRTFTADPGIAISFSSISLASQYYIGFTASIPLELNNKLGGVSYSDFAVSIDNENLSSEEFGITDLGCGNYLLEINAPSVEGEYDIEIYAGSDYETGTLNMKHLNFNITYLGTLTDDDKKDQIAYAASGNVTVGIATDSLAGDITTSNDALNLVLDPMGGSSYIFAVPSPSSLRAVDRLLEEKEFSEVINPNFGSEIEKVQYKTTLKLDYAYADIYSLMSESEEYGFEQFMPGKYSMLVKNTGTDPDTGNQKIEIIVS